MEKSSKLNVLCSEIALCILAWIVFIFVIIPVTAVVFVPLYILKYYVIVPLALTVHSDIVQSFCPHEGVMGQDNFYNGPTYSNLSIALIMDGHIDVTKLRECITKNVLNRVNDKGKRIHEKMCHVPIQYGGHLFWKKTDKLDLCHHIYEDKSPISKMEFQDYCSQWITTPYTKNKPLWEISVHSNYETSKSAVVVKMHHSLSDGLTFIKILDFLIDAEPLSYEGTNHKKMKFPWWKMVPVVFTAPLVIARLYIENMFQRNNYSRFKSSKEAIISWTKIPTNDLKQIKKELDVPFAVAGLATFAGSVLRWDKKDGENTDLQVVLPMPWRKHRNDTMSNNWTAVFVKIPGACDDKALWVEEVKANTIKNILSGSNIFAKYSTVLLSLLPRPILKIFMNSGYNGFFLAYTTIPGRYDQDIFIDGNLVLEMIPLVGPQYRHASLVSASYNYKGISAFSVTANKDIFPDRKLIDKMVNEFIHDECNSLGCHKSRELNGNLGT